MIRTTVGDLRGQAGETVTIAGWVQALRLQRALQFIIVRDHTGAVQVTHRRDGTALEAALDGLAVESAVRVTGRVAANPVVSLGGLAGLGAYRVVAVIRRGVPRFAPLAVIR